MKKQIQISLSVKFAATFAALFFVAMLIVAYTVHKTVSNQLTDQYNRNVNATVSSITMELRSMQIAMQNQLSAFAGKISDDTAFRLQIVAYGDRENPYVINYAQNYMPTMGLQALEVLDRNGTALSVGQYKAAFGTSRNDLLSVLQANPYQSIIGLFHHPTGSTPCLVALDSVVLGGENYYLLGGVEISAELLQRFLSNSDEILLALFAREIISSAPLPVRPELLQQAHTEYQEEPPAFPLQPTYSMGKIPLQYFTGDTLRSAGLYLFHPTADLVQLVQGLNLKIFTITGIVILLAILTSIWRTNAVITPLKRLVEIARNFSFSTLDTTFNVRSNDEVGVLNDALQGMVNRLRSNHLKLAKAEQKAALAEISRQVNHDIKNGIIPIRNVLQHWEEVARDEPANLSRVFSDRKSTIKESIDYLKTLTENYSKLQPDLQVRRVNVPQLLEKLHQHYQHLPNQQISFQMNREDHNLVVLADSVQLRRAFDNIIRNAVEATPQGGTIALSCRGQNDEVIFECADNGDGIPQAIQEQLFTKPVTTKPEGSGIGLTNTKRIIEDFNGRIVIESAEGEGTTVTIRLPLAEGNENGEQ
ncbi:MAG TPA: HAMP domain-containing sensor histidine kinase [bacterium]|nr:HAMP domain-containing sensor histidine kinase [bacterium]